MSQATPTDQTRPPDISRLLDELGANARIKHNERALIKQNGSLRTALMADAWRDAGIDKNEPGTVDQYYYRDEGIVLIDLEGRFRDGDE